MTTKTTTTINTHNSDASAATEFEPKPFLRQPEVIQAAQLTLENFEQVSAWTGATIPTRVIVGNTVIRASLVFNTPEGKITAHTDQGRWVLRDSQGGVRVLTDDAFTNNHYLLG